MNHKRLVIRRINLLSKFSYQSLLFDTGHRLTEHKNSAAGLPLEIAMGIHLEPHQRHVLPSIGSSATEAAQQKQSIVVVVRP